MDASSTPQVLLGMQDTLFVWCVVIFALFFPVWDILFRPVRRLYDRRGSV